MPPQFIQRMAGWEKGALDRHFVPKKKVSYSEDSQGSTVEIRERLSADAFEKFQGLVGQRGKPRFRHPEKIFGLLFRLCAKEERLSLQTPLTHPFS